MKFLGIIPARYASTRFPGKPLVMLGDKTIINHVYDKAKLLVDRLIVATDNEDIYNHVRGFGGEVVMTSSMHNTGTDRCREALDICGYDCEVVINIQGDEPFIRAGQIELLKSCFDNGNVDIATLIKPFGDCGYEELSNVNTPKVVVDRQGKAIMFSRSVIPYLRGEEKEDWTKKHCFYKHIGIYAYRLDVLRRISEMEQTPIEKAESLEQLRWIENGLHIQTAITEEETIGIDTPEDLERAKRML